MNDVELAQWLKKTQNDYRLSMEKPYRFEEKEYYRQEIEDKAWLLTTRELREKIISDIDDMKYIEPPTHDFSKGWNMAIERIKSRLLKGEEQ